MKGKQKDMKKYALAIMLLAGLGAVAQNKIDFAGRLVIDETHRLEQNGGMWGDYVPLRAVSLGERFSVVVELNDTDYDFGGVGAEVLSRAGNMAIVSATARQMEEMSKSDSVKRIALGDEVRPMMYKARPAVGVDAMQAGTDGLNGVKYTGRGVIAGLFDTGLDVNHVNFLDSNGEPRTQAIWVYANGKESAYTTPSQIKNFATEEPKQSHGTHVLGIMAGGYNGAAQYAVINSKNQVEVTQQNTAGSAIPFYGVATDADLAVACGTLSDGNILQGVQRIVDFAKAKGQPCVVNLSVGNNMGPHDGTDATSRYLAELGKEAIICVAAGNEGDENISIATIGETLKTFVSTTNSASGTVQFWGSNSDVFTVRLIAYDRTKGEIYSYAIDTNLAGKAINQASLPNFATTFNGTVTLSSNIDPVNKRYNVTAQMSLTAKTSSVRIGFVIEPKTETQRVDGFANSLVFVSESQPGFTDGSPANSINGMACGDNILVVGSFTTAASFATISGSSYTYSPRPTVGAISSFSSYGETFEGRKLPDVCAPGEVIISSYNQYYVDAGYVDPNMLAGQYKVSGLLSRNSSWAQMQGTSMASPFAAGVITAWMEADPALTIADVKEIINETSANDIYTSSQSQRWGAGKIDALAGIKAVLNRKSGVESVAVEQEGAIVRMLAGGEIEIFVAGSPATTGRLYSLSGHCVATGTGDSTVNMSANNVSPGVYVLNITTDKGTESRKVVIK